MATLILIRHGETDDNARQVFQGQGGSGLNARGREQAQRIADRLASVHVDHVISSDLERAVQTAAVIATRIRVSVAKDTTLREVDVGSWTGKSEAQIKGELPEEWAAWLRGLDIPRGGGETYRALGLRMIAALERIATDHPTAVVVIVSHGAAIRSAVGEMLKLSDEARRSLAHAHNTGVTVFETTRLEGGMRFELRLWNDVRHLDDPLLRIAAPRAT